MIDFPSSPSVGQIFTAAGASWRWDGTKWVAYGGGSSGDVGRNLIHNPLFNISQRTGPWTSGTYTLDRWALGVISDAISFSQSVLTDADRSAIGDEQAAFALQNVFTGNAAAGAMNVIAQCVENVRRLSGKTITVSFWAKAASGTPKLGVSIDQNFGTGGSPSAIVNGAGQSVTLSTTFARFSLQFSIASIAGKTLGTNGNDFTILYFWYSSGTTNATRAGNVGVQSGTIQIWGVQLEIGSTATPLEKPDPQQDLAKCQRFYQLHQAILVSGYAGAGAVFYNSYIIPTMRAAPSAAAGNTTYSNASGFSVLGASATRVTTQVTATVTGTGWCQTDLLLSADL